MKGQRRWTAYRLGFFLLAVLTLAVGVYAAMPQRTTSPRGITTPRLNVTNSNYLAAENKTDILKYPQQPASYTVWKDNSTGTPIYYAINGTVHTVNSSTTIQDHFTGKHGSFSFKEGDYNITGIMIDPDVDYETYATYLRGQGVRATTIRHQDGTSPTINFTCGTQPGNFGGVSDMTVYGAGESVGTANIIHDSNSLAYDNIYENLIVRYGGGDAMHIESAGCRLNNLWLENVDG